MTAWDFFRLVFIFVNWKNTADDERPVAEPDEVALLAGHSVVIQSRSVSVGGDNVVN